MPAAFDRAARGYDLLVGANPGYHRHLRMSAARMGLPGDGAGLRLLDVGCGTGASTAALLAAYPAAEVVAVDGSAGMVERARAKRRLGSVRFVHARLEDLPGSGVYGPFDGVLAAYLVRNLPDPDGGLAALRGLLAPGAPLVVHDYSVADSRRARLVWDAVCAAVIVPSGRLVTGDAELYRYLWRSVREFDGVAAFRARLVRAGFAEVRSATVPGWQRGVVHTWLGYAPRE